MSTILDTVVVGAGFSGLCALIRLRQEFPRMTVEVFEQADDIGGTWAKNTYPGLSCDIPSQVYSLSFAPDFDWSSTYGTQSEILSYIHHVASTHSCSSNIRVGQRCIAAQWLEAEYLWKVDFVNRENGQTYERYCRFLITGTGFCDIPKGNEDIHGIEKFAGKVFHSSNWDHGYAFDDKNVLVIGNGSSANQFIPWLVKNTSARSLVQVVRSAHWVAPKSHSPSSKSQRWVLRNVPFVRKIWRYGTAVKLDLVFKLFKKSWIGSALRDMVQRSVADYMRRTAPRQYHNILIPDFDLGAKRPVLDHGYLATLHDTRVTLIKSRLLSVSGPSEVTIGGDRQFPIDVIILANGFRTQELLTPMRIRGIGDAELPHLWQTDGNPASAYMGVAVSRFPNLFILTGPNTLPSGHSTLIGIESSVEYIIRLLRIASKDPAARVQLNVKPSAQESYNNGIQEKLSHLVYTSDVPNWYIDETSGRNTLIWPGSQFDFWWSRCVSQVQWKDFELEIRRA